MKAKQRGKNNKFPYIIEAWKKGDPVPEWLSDRAKVSSIDNSGQPNIQTNNIVGGSGYEIIGSDGKSLVITKNIDDYVCLGDKRIFALTKVQFDLMYDSI